MLLSDSFSVSSLVLLSLKYSSISSKFSAEIAILNDDNELTPNSVINVFHQVPFYFECIGITGHSNLTWQTEEGVLLPNGASDLLPSVFQSGSSDAPQIVFLNPPSISAVRYYCHSDESGLVAEVIITATNPYLQGISPKVNYLPVGGHFSFITVQYADNSTGYQNFGDGFFFNTSFVPANEKQPEMILETRFTSNFTGNEYSYGGFTRLNEHNGIYQINGEGFWQ